MSIVSSVSRWTEFYQTYKKYEEEAQRLLDCGGARGLQVDYSDVCSWYPAMGEELLEKPGELISHAEDALLVLLKTEKTFRVHFAGTPHPLGIRDLRVARLSRLVLVEARVLRVGSITPRMSEAAYECMTCHNFTRQVQDESHLREPSKCDVCHNDVFHLDPRLCRFEDFQEVVLVDPADRVTILDNRNTLSMHLTDDLVGTVQKGDTILVSGILQAIQQGTKAVFTYRVDANHIAKKEAEGGQQ